MNKKHNMRKDLFPTLARTSPLTFGCTIFIYAVVNPSYESFYLLVMYTVILCSSWVLKNLIIKPFYKLIRQTNVPVLTFGLRPKAAKGCSSFVIDDKFSNTFGIPSNHVQLIWAVVVYILCKITVNWNNATKSTYDANQTAITALGHIWIIVSWIILLSFSMYVSYSRIYIEECNTLFQIVVSALIGGISGFLVYWYENDAVNFLKEKLKYNAPVIANILNVVENNPLSSKSNTNDLSTNNSITSTSTSTSTEAKTLNKLLTP